MHNQRAICVLVMTMVFAVSMIASTITIAQSGTNNALVTKTPEQSNLIIDCSFGEGEKEDCNVQHFFQLANNVMKLLLWVAITGAGLLIFYKGTKLAINVFTKGGHQQARKEAQDALKATLIGLLFILSAYLIVKAGFDIIGYNLNDGNPFKYDESALPAPDVSKLKPSLPHSADQVKKSAEQNLQTTTPTDKAPAEQDLQTTTPTGKTPAGLRSCAGCQTRTSDLVGVPFKETKFLCENNLNTEGGSTLNPTESCWVSASVGEKLQTLATKSRAKWRVTEACPPTIKHANECHLPANCTCVDANFTTDNPSATDITAFIVAAKNSGFKAIYEIKSKEVYDNLADTVIAILMKTEEEGGLGLSQREAAKRIDHIPKIGADHFSLYSQ